MPQAAVSQGFILDWLSCCCFFVLAVFGFDSPKKLLRESTTTLLLRGGLEVQKSYLKVIFYNWE